MNFVETKPQKILLSDLDDTLTCNGILYPEAYQQLWNLYYAGVTVVIVTGRPAGFCEFMIRFWPIRGVIGENGAFFFYKTKDGISRWFHPDAKSLVSKKESFQNLEKEILANFPRAKVAADQFCRMYDLAIDFAEDVTPPMSLNEAYKIADIFHHYGVKAKVSSIHVNAWFGDYSKLETALIFLEAVCNFDRDRAKKEVYYIGDSPNDEPMFSYFKKSFAVGNIIPFLNLIKPPFPIVISKNYHEGFQELAKWIVEHEE